MKEKNRILILAFFSFFLLVVVAVLDGWFTIRIFEEGFGEWSRLSYWLIAMSVLVSFASLGLGIGSLMGDYGTWTLEDYYAVILLFAQPWILMWGGLLDLISASVQNYIRAIPLFNWWTYTWTWLDPPATVVPTLPHLISRLLGYANTVSVSLIIGSAITLALVFLLWAIYYHKT